MLLFSPSHLSLFPLPALSLSRARALSLVFPSSVPDVRAREQAFVACLLAVLPPRAAPTAALGMRERFDAARAQIRRDRADLNAEFKKQRNAGRETLNALKARSASAMVDEGYYQHQAQIAKAEEDFKRRRAEQEDDAAEEAEERAYSARKMALQAADDEQAAIDEKHVALAKAADLDRILRQRYLTVDQAAKARARQLEAVAAHAYAVGLSATGETGDDRRQRSNLAQWEGGSAAWAESATPDVENRPSQPADAWGQMHVAGAANSVPRWLRHGLSAVPNAGSDPLGGRWTSFEDSEHTFIPSRLQAGGDA
jgi:hypothetical protein